MSWGEADSSQGVLEVLRVGDEHPSREDGGEVDAGGGDVATGDC